MSPSGSPVFELEPPLPLPEPPLPSRVKYIKVIATAIAPIAIKVNSDKAAIAKPIMKI